MLAHDLRRDTAWTVKNAIRLGFCRAERHQGMQRGKIVGMSAEKLGSIEVTGSVDYYVRRLAVAQRKFTITARTDIKDANGIRLVSAGQAIDDQIADKVINHQLAFGEPLPIPIGQLVEFAHCIDGQLLFHRTYALFGKHADLMAIHKTVSNDDELKRLTVSAQYPDYIWQKLTILEQQLPDRFDEALFCAWFSALIARQLKLGDEVVQQAYLAGLVRDIGLLNLPDEVLNKTGQLTAADWRIIQSHVEFSRLCLVISATVHPAVIQAVTEHHERCDGSGYPAHSRAEKLSQLGLIVGLADTLQALRFRQFAKVKRCLYDAIPYLQMSGAGHSAAVANGAIMLLRNSGLQTTRLNPCASVSEYAFQILSRAQNLLTQIGYLDQILQTLQALPLQGQGKLLVEGAAQVQAMIVSSGLTRGELLQWLESLQGQDDDNILAELNELDLMLNELRWHVQKLTRSIDAFFEANTEAHHVKANKTVSDAADGLRSTLKKS